MQDEAVALFSIHFKRLLIQAQGAILFSLALYWLTALWGPIRKRMSSSNGNAIWFLLCVLFGTFLGAVSALDWGSEFLLVGVSIGLSVALALFHPTVALCLMMSLLFLRPWELVQNSDYFLMLPKLTFVICFAQTIMATATRKKVMPHWCFTASALMAYALWVLITTFKAPDPSQAQSEYFDQFFKSAFLYVTILNAIETREDLNVLIGTVIITFLGVGLICLFQTMGYAEISQKGDVRLMGFGAFGNTNDIAALMVLVFPFSLMVFLRKEGSSPVLRALGLMLSIVVLVALILAKSRASVMALGGSLCLYGVLKVKSKAITTAFIALLVLSVPLFAALSHRNEEDLTESSASRFTYIKTGLVMGAKNPVFGVGYNRYQDMFESYATEILYEWGHRTAHNSWILAFAETGLTGVVLFATVFFSAFRASWRVFPRAPEFMLAMTGYGICITFLSHTYLLYPYMLYGLVGCADRLYKT
jgi:hypothetical protein